MARGLRAGRVDFARISQDARAVEGLRGVRKVSFTRDAGYMETRLLARADVGEQPVEGPAVIESYDCTIVVPPRCSAQADATGTIVIRSEEHTSELQSLMRISYAVFCLKKKKHSKY